MENLVKTWEAQASHFKDFYQWTAIDHTDYSVRANDGETIPGKLASEIGNYNALMKDCPAYRRCKYREYDLVQRILGLHTIMILPYWLH